MYRRKEKNGLGVKGRHFKGHEGSGSALGVIVYEIGRSGLKVKQVE